MLGDNVAALQAALALTGRGSFNAVAKEIAWRKARRGWRFEVGHLPKEANLLADALSRQAAACPDPIAFPTHALAAAKRAKCPDLRHLWKVI